MQKIKRTVNGILLLNKPTGLSSNKALQIVKHAFQAKKAGHTGALDPLATGLLPICFGEATKFSQFWLDSDKVYNVIAKLGVRTTTSDAQGDVVETHDVPSSLTLEMIEQKADAFRGDIMQVPSMFSALKYQGQPLYKLARQGIEVERPARPITIYELRLLALQGDELAMQVHCSKGTYIRTLVDDLGQALGISAHVQALHRTQVGSFTEPDMISMPTIEQASIDELDHMLLPLGSGLESLPSYLLSAADALTLQQGGRVQCTALPPGVVVLRTQNDKRFIGLGEMQNDQTLKPRRLLSTTS